jgi:hypothetical protein
MWDCIGDGDPTLVIEPGWRGSYLGIFQHGSHGREVAQELRHRGIRCNCWCLWEAILRGVVSSMLVLSIVQTRKHMVLNVLFLVVVSIEVYNTMFLLVFNKTRIGISCLVQFFCKQLCGKVFLGVWFIFKQLLCEDSLCRDGQPRVEIS